MRGKIFCADEVNQMLPLVTRIADDVVAAYGAVNDALQAFQAEETRAKATSGRDAQLAAANERVGKSLDAFQGLIEELEALGGTLRDYERGSVDFYGEVDGEIVYLCWQPGEQHVTHWHRLDEGFTRRRPLTAGAAA